MNRDNNIVISAHDLWKIYQMGRQEVHALCGVTFNIHHNEMVAIMGPSGSGKSTLMNLIGCLDTPSRGEYLLKGENVSEFSENDLARIRNEEIGFVFQVFNLLPRADAFHNVELPLIYKGASKKEREEKVRRALQLVEIDHRMDHKPSELSGGERQRVAIARALVNEPAILLADEPTGNLDTKTGQEILNLFHKIHEDGNTLIVVTHDPEIAEQAERIIYIRDGKIEREVKKGA
ncbi:MAG: ABC transporter ATP-binding protein [Acidobacteria bacterium]|nr:ABC transporter ATP-binding protein [Acidobacteriota bacterium]MBU2438174.1 ABC transporter ATP-binding protein [Acidobacteriota bacterium]MBU4253907.1 ABC transporter ATP-binding protein [Acidobacteriota bacterium]MBU4329323.1 ABC transporter ATP-binding protein [Acidobacteriota bacterium]MCG2816668.1 ABC transporter ATP-binding protein [Candidatus Aminicenantes bacterium]